MDIDVISYLMNNAHAFYLKNANKACGITDSFNSGLLTMCGGNLIIRQRERRGNYSWYVK